MSPLALDMYVGAQYISDSPPASELVGELALRTIYVRRANRGYNYRYLRMRFCFQKQTRSVSLTWGYMIEIHFHLTWNIRDLSDTKSAFVTDMVSHTYT